jgi:hypothetical protein
VFVAPLKPQGRLLVVIELNRYLFLDDGNLILLDL